MKIRTAERKQSKIRIGITGPSGSGKTYSAILLGMGLTNDISKICVIDTESGSADLYDHLGKFNVITVDAPFSPERIIEAIQVAEEAKMDCIIIDSISHSWEYLVSEHAKLTGNSFTNWSYITPRHKALIDKLLSTKTHVIATLRAKTDYVLSENNKGKIAPQKVGLKAIQRDGIDYEFTIYFELDISHHAHCTKDRTNLFADKNPFVINEVCGTKIKNWCHQGISISEVKTLIHQAKDMEVLRSTYDQYGTLFPELHHFFVEKKNQLSSNTIQSPKIQHNGFYQK